MAVGVDYSLFYLRREREERTAGRDTREALRIAAATSGRAIVVSGLTVMIALAGLFLTGYDVFTGSRARHDRRGRRRGARLAHRAARAAVLARAVGRPGPDPVPRPPADRRPPVPGLGRPGAPGGRAARWRGAARPRSRCSRWPRPRPGMRLGSPAIDLPASSPVLQTVDRISQAFPQSPSPAQVVVTGTGLSGPGMRDAIGALQAKAAAGGPIHEPITVTPVARGRGLIIGVPLAGNGGDAASDRCPAHPAQPGPARHAGPGRRDQLRGDRGHRAELRRHRRAALGHPGGGRVRGRARVRAAAGGVPLGHDPAGLDRAEPAVGRRRLRPDHPDLPGRPAAGAARLHLVRRDHPVDTAVHVRAAVRAEHGLPRVHPQPDPRAALARGQHPRGASSAASPAAPGW